MRSPSMLVVATSLLTLSACDGEQASEAPGGGNRADGASPGAKAPEANAEARSARVTRGAAPFPDGYDYPQSNKTISGWVDNRNGARIREHGWYLWAGLNQPGPGGDRPVWRSWPTSSQVFPRADAGGTGSGSTQSGGNDNQPMHLKARNQLNAAAGLGEPIDFKKTPEYTVPETVRDEYTQCYSPDKQQLVDGPTFQNNGDVMIAGVVYNAAAARHLIASGAFSAQILDKRIPESGGDPPKHFAMPDASIVLKPMLWPVKAEGFTALPVWDDLSPSADDGKYAGFEIQALWQRAVAVSDDASPPPTHDVRYLVKDVALPDGHETPNTYNAAPVASVDDFYHFRYDDDQLGDMAPCDRALLDASAQWSYGRDFAAGDYLVLIAMHVITHEQDGWTFQSVWWHDQPDQGRYAGDRPSIPQAQGPWRHYLLTSTYGMQQIPGHQHNWPPCLRTKSCANNRKWPVAYNPYIELAAAHPIATNCRNCHWRAGWPSPSHQIAGRPHSSYLAGPTSYAKHPPDALDVFTINDTFLNGLLTLDSMWAVADRAD